MSNSPLSHLLIPAAAAWQKVKDGTSIDKALSEVAAEHRAVVQSLLYAVVRNRMLVSWIVKKIALREPKPQVAAILEIALAQAIVEGEKPFTLVNQAVAAIKSQRSTAAAANFCNAVLRKFYREKQSLLEEAQKDEEIRFNAPRWWIEKYRLIFGKDADHILTLQREHPLLVLRVNRKKISRAGYLKKLEEAGVQGALPVGLEGVALMNPLPVSDIPGFKDGEVSVQDAGSQLAAQVLAPQDGMVVLDACAAPGGKTGHLLETADIKLDAIEKDPIRAKRIYENLERLGLDADVKVADVGKIEEWHKAGKLYDRILLDAPCSATGILRRHPDIPWLKDLRDVRKLAKTQAHLLEQMWKILAKQGRMLYVVCSVMPEEGVEQIEKFVASHADAELVPFEGAPKGYITLAPHQAQANDAFMPWVRDGFFYALLEKH